eukprot:gene22278-16710_t
MSGSITEVMNPQVKNRVVTVAKAGEMGRAGFAGVMFDSRLNRAGGAGLRVFDGLDRERQSPEGAGVFSQRRRLDEALEIGKRVGLQIAVEALAKREADPWEEVRSALDHTPAKGDAAGRSGQRDGHKQLAESVNHACPDGVICVQCLRRRPDPARDRRTGRKALDAVPV